MKKKFLRQSPDDGTSNDASDEALLREYRRTGEEKLIATLFNRYVHLVYGTCRQFLGSNEDARDTTMLVFERILHQAKKTEIQDFPRWLYSASKNLCISRLREAEKTARYKEDWEILEKSKPEFMENEGFLRLYHEGSNESTGKNQRLVAALSQLDKGQRTCIRLFFFDKKSYKAIARQTGYSVQQVKSYLQNGKRNLRLLLNKDKDDK